MTQGGKKHGRARAILALKAAALLIFLGLLGRALAHADLSGAAAHLRSVGPFALLVLVPFPLALAADAVAWRMLLARIEHRVGLARLFRVRVATESITTAVPAGGLAAEAVGPFLVAPDAPLAASFTSSATKRWLIIRTHGYYVAIALALGFGAIVGSSHALLHDGSLPWVVGGCAIALVGISFAGETMTTRLGLASRFHDATESLRGSRIFSRLGLSDIPRTSYEAVDEHLKKLGKTAHPVPALLILVAWLLESVESWIILRALGVEIGWVTVLSFDAALSVVRTAAAFAPAGLGAQDLGYLAFFEAYGIPNASAIGPAFLVLKRTNQLVWVVIGFTLLMLARKGPAEPAMEAA